MSLFKAKKFFASRMSDTKAGRTAVLRYVGEDGNQLVAIMKALAIEYTNRDTGKLLKKDLMKLASKCALLYQEGRISIKDGEAIGPVADRLARHLMDACGADQVDNADIDDIVRDTVELHAALHPLLAQHMKPSNADRLSHLCTFYGDRTFVASVLRRDGYTPLRLALSQCLRRLIDPLSSRGHAVVCSLPGCPLPKFHSVVTSLCGCHHYQDFRGKILFPRLADLLASGPALDLWRKFVAQHGLLHHFLLAQAVDDYRAVSNRSLRPRRGKHIADKFLQPGAPSHVAGLSGETVAAALAEAEEGRANTFQQVRTEAMQAMEAAFALHFVGSRFWKEYVSMTRLVEYAKANPPRPVVASIPKSGEGSVVPFPDGALAREEVEGHPVFATQLTVEEIPPAFRPASDAAAAEERIVVHDSDEEEDSEEAAAGAGAAKPARRN